MKRAISSIIFGGATIFAFGQGSFTIVRPFDGSKVREMVKVLFPNDEKLKDSGYVGIFIDGKFLEAVAPKVTADKKYWEYALDTKTIDDGSHKLEAKLYVDFNNQPRIVDTSSVDITIANRTSIAVPEDGFSLKYKFNTGTSHTYRMQERTIQNVISEADQKKLGSRPFQIEEEGESLKIMYACDNAYPNGDGLMRMQIVPDRGMKNREYSYLTVPGNDGPQKFYPADMAPIYMRVQPSGREVFGAIPDYFGLEGNTGTAARLGLFASFPLPTLPSQAKKPGDTWQANFQLGALDLQNMHTQKSVVDIMPARGDFVGVEWEMGHPCAKLRNSIAQGTSVGKLKDGAGSDKISDKKVSVDQTIWFALDTGVVVKFNLDITYEGKGDFGIQTGGTSGGGGVQQGAPSNGGNNGGDTGKGGKKGGGSVDPGDFTIRDRFQGPPRAAGTNNGSGQAARSNGPGGPGGATVQAFIRIRRQYLFVLEK
ncbi:MAG: hypothetical protein WCG75_04045 [Armatimonadota bacterium]